MFSSFQIPRTEVGCLTLCRLLGAFYSFQTYVLFFSFVYQVSRLLPYY